MREKVVTKYSSEESESGGGYTRSAWRLTHLASVLADMANDARIRGDEKCSFI